MSPFPEKKNVLPVSRNGRISEFFVNPVLLKSTASERVPSAFAESDPEVA